MAVVEIQTDSDILAVPGNYGAEDITVVQLYHAAYQYASAENHNHNGGDSIINSTRSDSEHYISMIV